MDSWLSIDGMMETHNLERMTIYQFIRTTNIKDVVKRFQKAQYINESVLLRIRRDREKLWHRCTNRYYTLQIDYNITDADMSRQIIDMTGVGGIYSWAAYLSTGMWHYISDKSILDTRTSTYLEAFDVWSESILNPIVLDVFDTDSYPDLDISDIKEEWDMYLNKQLRARDRIIAKELKLHREALPDAHKYLFTKEEKE